MGGCTSLGRGVAEGVLSTWEREPDDKRMCDVDGAAFNGVAPMLERQSGFGQISPGNAARPSLKVVYVHGIGEHMPGHGADLIRSLASALGLSVRAKRIKHISLTPPSESARPYGEVNIIRLTDSDRSRELLFFEHTWSEITAPKKQSIAFDGSPIHRSRRAAINQRVREFANNVLPDAIAFTGARGPDIRGSVEEALCWAFSTRWQDLPDTMAGARCEDSALFGSRVRVDDIVVATHSLGSRAVVDALQKAARYLGGLDAVHDARKHSFAQKLRDTEVTLFMLSNQLPLLEAGQTPQTVTGQQKVYCGDRAERTAERFLRRLDMIAFSDPNDVLSYPIPAGWADQYLDSRLCSSVRNVTINVAHVRRLPIFGEFANPLQAHVEYNRDERVAGLMAYGIGHRDTAPLIRERCTWTDVDPALD